MEPMGLDALRSAHVVQTTLAILEVGVVCNAHQDVVDFIARKIVHKEHGALIAPKSASVETYAIVWMEVVNALVVS